MADDTKLKIKLAGAEAEVLVLVNHPMETGARKDKDSGQLVPAHFIQKMTFEHNGKVVADADIGGGVSKNPLIGIKIGGAKAGDKVKIAWTDNKGTKGGAEEAVA
jgi:sulfur-oxidizing protein SoxZ